MIDNDMTQYNFKLTFTRNGLKSCIDHIYSNCSYKITDVVTQNDILSDYNILTFKRDLLNADILTQYCGDILRIEKNKYTNDIKTAEKKYRLTK